MSGVPLARAREMAAACRLDLAERRNPLDVRRAAQEAEREADQARRNVRHATTFGDVADTLLAAKGTAWTNAKHAYQWRQSLEVYAAPLRALPVAEINTEHILSTLQPIWLVKPETASRTRGRIEAVLDAARARGLIPAHEANPARWKGHLDHILPTPAKLTRGHHAAMPWKDVPAFVAQLRQRDGVSPWLSLTRTPDIAGAKFVAPGADIISLYAMIASIRRGPFCTRAISNSRASASAVSTATDGTPKPSPIFTQSRYGLSKPVMERLTAPS